MDWRNVAYGKRRVDDSTLRRFKREPLKAVGFGRACHETLTERGWPGSWPLMDCSIRAEVRLDVPLWGSASANGIEYLLVPRRD